MNSLNPKLQIEKLHDWFKCKEMKIAVILAGMIHYAILQYPRDLFFICMNSEMKQHGVLVDPTILLATKETLQVMSVLGLNELCICAEDRVFMSTDSLGSIGGGDS